MNDQERSIIRALQHSQPLLKRLPNRRPKAAAETGSTTMPRDLDHEKPLPVIPLITESPNRMPDSPVELSTDSPAPVPGSKAFVVVPKSKQYTPTNLHPYTRPLTVSDIEAVVALENAAFPDPNERASREKLLYRLSKCGELSLGIFETIVPGSGNQPETLEAGRLVETGRRNKAISVLIGHVVAAKTTSLLATDESMDYPKDWDSEKSEPSNLGHQEAGRTIALHSIAVLPQFQGRGIGRIIIMAYMQQMNGAGIADRLALIAHENMIPWYEKLAFVNKGKSICQFGGGGWFDLVYDLKTLEARATYG